MGSVVDLFAGPGGWDLAARELGLDPIGLEWDPAQIGNAIPPGLAYAVLREVVVDGR